MAKKILSILCALAMLVTMVSVAAFSVSADEPTTGTFDLSAGTYPDGTTFKDGTKYDGFTLMQHNGTATGTFAEPLTIGDSFEFSYKYNTYQGSTDLTNYSVVNIGNYSFKVAISADSWMYIPVLSILKDGVEVATVTAESAKYARYYTTAKETAAAEDTEGTYLYDIHKFYDSTVCAKSGTAYSFQQRVVTCSYENGVFTLSIVKLDPGTTAPLTLTYTDTTADFSNATMSVELSATKHGAQAIHGFTGTYAKAATSGGDEGGDEPDEPETPTTGEIVFDAENFDFPGTGNTFHGVPTGDSLKKYVLTARSVSTSANSKDTYNIGDKFDISFSLMMVDTVNHTWTVSVGGLDVVLTNGSSTRVTASATYNGQSVIAATPLTSGVGCKLINAGTADHTAFVDAFKSVDTAYTKTPGGFYICDVTIGYNAGTLTLNVAAPGNAGTTMIGTISNADFTDSDISIVFNRTANQWPVHAFHNFTGTYTPYVAPTTDPLAPGKFLSINDSLALNFAYAQGALADYTDVEVNASIGERGETLTPVTKTIEGTTYDVYVVDFLTPDLFGTDVEFSITAKKGGEDVSYETTYSVKDYCVNMISKDTSSPQLKSLCASILLYGQSVYNWQNNNNSDTSIVGDLADGVLDMDTVWSYEGLENKYGLSVANTEFAWVSGNLNLGDNIGINFNFNLPEGQNITDFKVFAEVIGSDIGLVGGEVESINHVEGNKYKAVARIFAYDMTKDVTAVIKGLDNEAVSVVFTSGVQNFILESIAQDKFDDYELNVAIALMTYGNNAAVYKASL